MLNELNKLWNALSQDRKDKIVYSWIHHKKVREMAEKLNCDERVKWHDMDKITMLLITNLSADTISMLHREQPHHRRDTHMGLKESIIDFEASSYTKIDKPQNAWGTLDKLKCFEDIELRLKAENMIISCGYETYPINRMITEEQYQTMVQNVNIEELFVHVVNYLYFKI